MELFPKKKLLNDAQILREAKSAISTSYQSFEIRFPNLGKLLKAVLVIFKWSIILFVIFISGFLFYQTFIEKSSDEKLPKLPSLKSSYARVVCLKKLGVPDTGQILLPSQCD